MIVCVCVCVCVCVFVCVCLFVCLCECIYVCVYMCVYMRMLTNHQYLHSAIISTDRMAQLSQKLANLRKGLTL